MELTKSLIDRHLRTIKQAHLVVKEKDLYDDIRFINKGVAASVLFKDVTVSEKVKKRTIELIENERVPNYTHMPFDDFCVLSDLTVDGGEKESIINGMLTRFTRSKLDPKYVIITTYIKTTTTSGFITVNFKAVDTETGNFDIVAYDKNLKAAIEDGKKDGGVQREMLNALLALMAILSYEPIVVKSELTFSERKRVPSGMTDKYIEYTLDLSRPTRRRSFKSKSLGGSHNSPCEHKRRGHTRTYKSGKVVRVSGTTVNKGSKSGIVEKDYSLGTTESTLASI